MFLERQLKRWVSGDLHSAVGIKHNPNGGRRRWLVSHPKIKDHRGPKRRAGSKLPGPHIVDRLGLEQGVPVNQVRETYSSIFVHFNLDGHGPLDARLSG
jgi:hypothetical protein